MIERHIRGVRAELGHNLTASTRRLLGERDRSLEAIVKIRERVMKKVTESRRRIQVRQEYVKHYGDRISVQRITNSRIDKGLTELTGMIQELRDVLTGESAHQNVTLDSAAHHEMKEEARKILKTKFFRELLKQAKVAGRSSA